MRAAAFKFKLLQAICHEHIETLQSVTYITMIPHTARCESRPIYGDVSCSSSTFSLLLEFARRAQLTAAQINRNLRQKRNIRMAIIPPYSVRCEINAAVHASPRGSLLLLPLARVRPIFAFSRRISGVAQFWSRRSDSAVAKYATALRVL